MVLFPYLCVIAVVLSGQLYATPTLLTIGLVLLLV